jgi:L-asparaginase
MEQALSQLRQYYHISVMDVMCLDSSNIRPADWQQIASCIFENREQFDGVVVSHGTDTMAYTASAVTFMLPNIDKCVVFTGSQLPLPHLLTDGLDNLRVAFAMAAEGPSGVFIAFDRKIIRGCRAVKVRASGFAAFESVNARYAATVSSQGLVINPAALPVSTGTPELRTGVSQTVFLLKLTPGLSPAIFDALQNLGYQGIVIEAFGLGGFNVLGRGLQGIQNAVRSGISVVVTTQCLYDSADLQVYEVGNRLLELGVIQGRDMTSEAAVTKLMWALGQGMDQKRIATLFATNLAGEISV